MNPGCVVRDPLGRIGRLITTEGRMGAVANAAPQLLFPGVHVNPRLDAVPLADLSEERGLVLVDPGDGTTWAVKPTTIATA